MLGEGVGAPETLLSVKMRHERDVKTLRNFVVIVSYFNSISSASKVVVLIFKLPGLMIINSIFFKKSLFFKSDFNYVSCMSFTYRVIFL